MSDVEKTLNEVWMFSLRFVKRGYEIGESPSYQDLMHIVFSRHLFIHLLNLYYVDAEITHYGNHSTGLALTSRHRYYQALNAQDAILGMEINYD